MPTLMRYFRSTLTLIGLMLTGPPAPTLAADWGYDDVPAGPVTSQPADSNKDRPGSTSGSPHRPPRSGPACKKAIRSPSGQADLGGSASDKIQPQTDETSLR